VLDLSRNAITSIQGFGQLKKLQDLNLYYNKILSLDTGDLHECAQLRVRLVFLALLTSPFLTTQTLSQTLDLRLNPVTRSPKYRTITLRNLPWLQVAFYFYTDFNIRFWCVQYIYPTLLYTLLL
jgi:Leucine-rich repeat (LRR) protein